jgi:hypothetical protein
MVADEDEDRRGRGHVAVASMPLMSSESLHKGEGEVDKATALAVHIHRRHCRVWRDKVGEDDVRCRRRCRMWRGEARAMCCHHCMWTHVEGKVGEGESLSSDCVEGQTRWMR